jgi:hypothetical protein
MVLQLSQLKEFPDSTATSNQSLLTVNDDVSQPTTRSVYGTPLRALPSGVIEPGFSGPGIRAA